MSETITSIQLNGNNNVVIQSVNNSQVTVQTVNWDDFVKKYTIEERERIAELKKSLEKSEELLDTNKKLYNYEGLELSQQINDLQKQLDSKEAQIKEIISSYKDKDLSDANTSPLYREALSLFLNGKIDAVLDLLSEAKLEEEEIKTAQLRILKAQALQLEYRFEEAAVNFEKSVAIAPTWVTHGKTGVFYQYLNKLEKAEQHYKQALPEAINNAERAVLLHNLAVLYKDQKDFGKAEKLYEEALEIFASLSEINLRTFLPYMAGALHNLAVLYVNQDEFDKAENVYGEALIIREFLAQMNPATFDTYITMTLHNLAKVYYHQNKFIKAEKGYDEVLDVYRGLAQTNPNVFLPYVATTLNNLAILYTDQKEFVKAEKGFDEALEICRHLAQTNPDTFEPDVAMTALNMSIFYRESYCDREKSVVYAKEALQSASPFMNTVPSVLKNAEKAMRILTTWGIDAEALLKNIKNGTQEEKDDFDWDELVKNVHSNRNTNNTRMNQNIKVDKEPRKNIFAAFITYLRRLF